MNIKVEDRIKLIYDVQEFNIHEYLNGDNVFSFSSIQLNIPTIKENKKFKNRYVLPFYAPIIASEYVEDVIKIEEENNRTIVYTKSFKIDFQNALKEKHISICKSEENEEIENENPLLKNFITELVENNTHFAMVLITMEERYNKLFYSFSEYFHRTFKNELEKLKQEDLKLSDDAFFKKTWEVHKKRNTTEGRTFKINNINFIWPLYPNDKSWTTPILARLIEMGLYDKLSVSLGFSGINLSKKKFGNYRNCYAYLDIRLTSFDSGENSIYNIHFFEKYSGYTDFKTENFWSDERFTIMLDKVLKSPVY